MIDLNQPIRFYDDTGRDKDYFYANKVLYSTGPAGIAIARIEDCKGYNIIDDAIVFEIVNKNVLNENLTHRWLAENYDPRHKPATTGEIDGELK